MNPAIQKTLALLLLIVIGLLLKAKLSNRDQLGGVKILILSVALPAMIFVALLKIQVETSLLFLPVLALGFNLLMLLAGKLLLPLFGVDPDSPDFRTYWLLMPSLAPGLSCFPFVIEYLGDASLAHAALADVGNKIYGLILAYLIAMHLYYKMMSRQDTEHRVSTGERVRGLLFSLLKEPINMVIVVGLIMLGLGWNLASLPGFLQDSILRMSAMMTPMVLIFIGMAVRFNRQQFGQIFNMLVCRSGLAFCLSALLISVAPISSPASILLAVAFPQSAASFWPFAHMSAVSSLEGEKPQTFRLELALNVLALSLPMSTVIIMTVCSVGTVFTEPLLLWAIGGAMLGATLLPALLRRFRSKEEEAAIPVPQMAEEG